MAVAKVENWLVTTAVAARKQGLKRYFTGKPCKHGHIDMRDTINDMCVSCKREYRRKYLAKTRKSRAGHRVFKFSAEQFDALLVAQNGMCAICETAFSAKTKANVDHDHKTGRIRGLLCFRCNVVLGHVKDSVTILEKLAAYLLSAKASSA